MNRQAGTCDLKYEISTYIKKTIHHFVTVKEASIII